MATAVMLMAARDAGYSPRITAVEPFPSPFLRSAQVRVLEKEAQEIPLEELTSLAAGDLLFIDSTHTVKVDSEVNLIVLEVLPRLPPGVWVHFHDIYFPFDYQRDVLRPPLFFWSEGTLVHAFLACNPRFRIAVSLSMLHYAAPEELGALIPRYRPQANRDGLAAELAGHFPSSLYLRSVGD